MAIYRIALTGGPGGGKSTGISRVDQELTEKGYKVFVVAETATENILGGIKPTELDILDFQDAIFKIQRSKEKVYLQIAKLYKEKDVVILFDRGCIDGKAFMTNEQFSQVLKNNKVTETKVRDFYDAVFHLKTAADGAEKYYTLENNAARSESPELARKIDRKIIAAWTGHSHFRVIDNSTDFEKKIDRLMTEIYAVLGIPMPIEIERKYLIKMPNLSKLQEDYDCTKVNIIQTYLHPDEDEPGVEKRIRQRGINGEYTYFLTKKQTITGLSRVETEKRISEEEYLNLLMDADTTLKQIRKDRYCFVYKNNYFELDIYPFWEDKAILEIELTSETSEVQLPDFLQIIKEVTEDISYKNAALAKNYNI